MVFLVYLVSSHSTIRGRLSRPRRLSRPSRRCIMRALVFNPTIPRFLVTKALGTVSRAAVWARTSGLQFREIPEPPLPGDEWVGIGARLGGICGSARHTIRLEPSPGS